MAVIQCMVHTQEFMGKTIWTQCSIRKKKEERMEGREGEREREKGRRRERKKGKKESLGGNSRKDGESGRS